MPDAGPRMKALVEELFPVCRSITGDGLRRTLQRIGEQIPLTISEVPTGTGALDWTVPNEWNIRDAWIANARGERVVDFRAHNLHVVNYSVPVRTRMTLDELRPHLHSLPDRPDAIPYRTSYYRESWGFCLSHRTLEALPQGTYDVCIDSTLAPGSLTYAECLVAGRTADEVLISCHCCHPSLANDNLSGIAVATELAQRLLAQPGRLTYRLLFIPGTIGSIVWLSRNEPVVQRIIGGFVLTGVGDRGPLTYKRSRRGNAITDRAFAHILHHRSAGSAIRPFIPYGYDERQYCSPGFDLPVGCLMRTPFDEYPEYHSSADNLDFVHADRLAEAADACEAVFDVMEREATYLNRVPRGEPQLGRRGLFRPTGGTSLPGYELALLWVLNQSDGTQSLLDIAERSGLPFSVIADAARDLGVAELLERVATR